MSGINIGSGRRGATSVQFSVVVVPVPVVIDSGAVVVDSGAVVPIPVVNNSGAVAVDSSAVVIAPIPTDPKVGNRGGGGVAYRVTLGLTARVVGAFTREGDGAVFTLEGERGVFTRKGERGVFTLKGERGAFTLEGDKGVRRLLLLPPLFVFVFVFVGVGVRARSASLRSEAVET